MSVHRIARSTTFALVTAALASLASFALAQDSLVSPPAAPPTGVTPTLLGPPGAWHSVAPTPLVLSARHGQSAISDPVNGRIVEFGGFTIGSGYRGDLIQLDLCGAPGWTPLAATGIAPSPRFGHSAIYDPVRQRMILFGGDTGGLSSELFSLTLTGVPAWSVLTATGGGPSGRNGHSAIYDPVRDRMIVFGGYDGSFRNDVWSLDLSIPVPAWSLLTPSGGGPSPRDYHGAIYDPVRDRMVVFGGNDGGTYNDVWALSLGASPAWTPILPAGTPPSSRLAQATVYDPVGDALIVVGGVTGPVPPGAFLDDAWSLSLGGSPAWTPLAFSGSIPPGHSRGAVFVPDFRRVILHGGVTTASSGITMQLSLGPPAEAHSLDFMTVQPRDGHMLVVDLPRRRFLRQGGEPFFSNEVFEMPMDGPAAWGLACLVGQQPSARQGHTAAYDPVNDVVWMHGGYDGAFRGDLWKLSLGTPMTWTPVAASGPPPGRDYASLVYDGNRNRLVLFGGNDAGIYKNDLWVFDAATLAWSPLAAAGTPPSPRLAHHAVFDAPRDRMLVYGGYDGAERGDLWALNFAPSPQWVQLFPGGVLPAGRHSASLLLDTTRDRLLLFGGYDGANSRNDLWDLPLTGAIAWSALSPSGPLPATRHGQGAAYDPLNDLILVDAGFSSFNGNLSDTWTLRFNEQPTPTLVSLASTEVEPGRVRITWQGTSDVRVGAVLRRQGEGSWERLGLAESDGPSRWVFEDRAVTPGVRYRYGIDFGDGPQAQFELQVPLRHPLSFSGLAPSPAGADSRLAFSLPSASRVTVEAFDAAGRRVASEDLGVFDAGAHRVSSARLTALPPGIYVLRLRTSAGIREARATFVR